jgi:signal transduction histidine kinase
VNQPLPAPARRPRTTLAVRVTVLVVAVAVLVAVVASVVGVLVVRRTLIDVTTQALSDRADVIAAQVTADPNSAARSLAATSAVLAEQGIAVVTIASDGSLSGPQRAVRAARLAGAEQAVGGRSVSGSVMLGALQLVQARSTSTGGFALVAPADVAAATRQALERRLAWAILAGLAAAVLVGFLIARLVSGPLRRTAGLARAMGQGARDLRAPVAGPREVADVSTAVNELADALQHSESRQRQFLTSVSHELRTPLAGITGQAQALADGLVPPEEQAEVGRSIRGEAARLDRLVSDLLDLARLGADST